jgi:Flp pilus assembly pilin Flp
VFYSFFQDFVHNESGQGINEYAAIMAFIALMIMLAFSVANGELATSLSSAFSNVVSQFDRLNGYTTT